MLVHALDDDDRDFLPGSRAREVLTNDPGTWQGGVGPFEKFGNPILENDAAWDGPGHGSIVTLFENDSSRLAAQPLPNAILAGRAR